jgi:hypothetical protein
MRNHPIGVAFSPDAESRTFPLLPEEGWPRHQQISRSLLSGADGVVAKFKQIWLVVDHHPVCAAKDASQLFLDRAATPPPRGGEIQLRLVHDDAVPELAIVISTELLVRERR